MKEDLTYRSEFLYEVFKDFIDPSLTVLEIGCGDGRNVDYLKKRGYNVVGIDKLHGTSIEEVEEKLYDVIFTMSTLFQIPPENAWVFEKIARMANKYIITIEGETTHLKEGDNLFGRNYTDVFYPFGFREVMREKNVFNEFGVLRVLKNEHYRETLPA